MRLGLSALLALAVLLWASTAPALTTGRPARLGLLDYNAPDEGRARWWDALRAGLRDLGYVEGRDVSFEPRWANGQIDRLPQLAAELVGLPVNLIVTAGRGAVAVFVVASPALFPLRRTIADLALRHRLPIMVGGREYAEAGGLVSYAVHYPDLFRRAAIYVDQILRGSKPGDLPVEQTTRFELIINTKTATALGVTIPQALLVRADELIR